MASYFNIQNSFSFSIYYYRMKRWNTGWQTLKYPADFKRSTWCLGENSSRSHERESMALDVFKITRSRHSTFLKFTITWRHLFAICYKTEDIPPRKKLFILEKIFSPYFVFIFSFWRFLINISRGKFWRIYLKATNIGSR